MKFEDINVGLTAEIVHRITDEDVKSFIQLTGDDNKLHSDNEFAAGTEFKKPVVHGMLGASFISTVIGTKLPGDGALWLSQNLEFLLPVRVGDMLTIRAVVLKKEVKSGIIELQTDIFNQHRQKVTHGTAKVKVIEHDNKVQTASITTNKRKVALVVGASGGIGSATCLALAEEGFDIAIHYHLNAEAAKAVGKKITDLGRRQYIISCDINIQSSTEAMIEKVVRTFGSISCLVNCSTAKIPIIKFLEVRWDDFEIHLNNQIKGNFNLVRSVVPFMEQQRYGKIITLNSQALETPSPGWLPYITAKGGLLGFTRALAIELAPKGIHVNSVSPGMTNTDLVADIPERVRLLNAAKTPLKRLATPDDIAKAIVFLASDKSDFLCGETIRVNGGQVMV